MGTERRLATRIILVIGLSIMLFALAPMALAGKGGNPNGGGGKGNASSSTGSSSTLGLTSETVQLNPNLPSWCLSEDDYDQRVLSGSLSGGFSTSYQTCGLNADGFTAGGIGLQSDVYVVGQLSDLAITAPDGGVHHAVLMGQATSKGVTSYHYAVCFVPLYFISNDTGTDPLPGGTWEIALSGQISNASWTTRAQMTDSVFQQNYCPPSEQNLSP
jgi:hypothetical protein